MNEKDNNETFVISNGSTITLDKLKEEFVEAKNKKRFAFVLGNGINRYNPNDLSWDNLLREVWNKCLDKDYPMVSEGITLTEIYDLMCLKYDDVSERKNIEHNKHTQEVWDEAKAEIRKTIKEKITSKRDYTAWLQDRLDSLKVPVLTTNYDQNIERNHKQYVINSPLYTKGYSDTYLFNVYYAEKELKQEDFFSEYSVWHINGRINHVRSIRIGTSDYMNLMAKTKFLLRDVAHLYNVNAKQHQWGIVKEQELNPNYAFTWLDIFYNSSLCINGLALNPDESYLRWLLISRKKYLERVELNDIKGWYVCHPSDLNDGKRLFLKGVGLDIVEIEDFKVRYEDLFDF